MQLSTVFTALGTSQHEPNQGRTLVWAKQDWLPAEVLQLVCQVEAGVLLGSMLACNVMDAAWQ